LTTTTATTLSTAGTTLATAGTTLSTAATMLGLGRGDAYEQRHCGRRDERSRDSH
jgi:hypothetical protein